MRITTTRYSPRLISPNESNSFCNMFQNEIAGMFNNTYVKGFAKTEMPIYSNLATSWNNHPHTRYTNLLRRTLDNISPELIIILTEKNVKDASDMSDVNWKKTAVEYRLTEDDEPALKRFASDAKNSPVDVLRELIGEGYKVSITLSSSNDSICVTATGTTTSRYNQESFLSAWSSDLSEAIYMLGYKHFEIFGGKTWKGKAKSSNWG